MRTLLFPYSTLVMLFAACADNVQPTYDEQWCSHAIQAAEPLILAIRNYQQSHQGLAPIALSELKLDVEANGTWAASLLEFSGQFDPSRPAQVRYHYRAGPQRLSFVVEVDFNVSPFGYQTLQFRSDSLPTHGWTRIGPQGWSVSAYRR